MELLLLETSGPYGIKDNNRFGSGHVKGSFGALTFLRKALKTWRFATEDTMRQLKVIFMLARGTKIHFWTMEIPSKEVQILDHVMSVEIPLSVMQVERILDLGNFIWKLIESLKYACNIYTKMNNEHEEYMISKYTDPNSGTRTNLSTFVELNIQKPEKGSQYGVLLPEQLEDCDIHRNLINN